MIRVETILGKSGDGDGLLPMKQLPEQEKLKRNKQKVEESCNFIKNAFVVDGNVEFVKSDTPITTNYYFKCKDKERGVFIVATLNKEAMKH